MQKRDKIICIVSLVIFGILTFSAVFLRFPFWDEANAWMIAKSFNLFELFQIEKYDGHLFLWHLTLMPFAKNNFLYPYSMLILNWAFCMGALIVFWKNSPFSSLTKILITFSSPFFLYFAIVARCYSIGLLILFIILSLWKKRFEHPIVISFLIVLFGNSSVMALAGAISFALIFSFELIIKKKFLYPHIILFFGFLLAGIQLFGAAHPEGSASYQGLFIKNLHAFIFNNDFSSIIGVINIFISKLSLIIPIFALYSFRKNKSAISFLIISYSLLLSVFLFAYAGQYWHYLFFYIYFISAFWIYSIRQKPDMLMKILFLTLVSLFCAKSLLFAYDKYDYIYNNQANKIYSQIKENKLIKDEDNFYIFDCCSEASIGIIPLVNKKTYDLSGKERYTLEGYKNNMVSPHKLADADNLAKTLTQNGRNIIISEDILFNSVKGENYNIFFTPIYSSTTPKFGLYEITSQKIKD